MKIYRILFNNIKVSIYKDSDKFDHVIQNGWIIYRMDIELITKFMSGHDKNS